METTTIILIVVAGAIIIMIYLRFFKKENDSIMPGKDPRKDEYYDLPADENTFELEEENKEQDIPEEEPSMIETEEGIEQANNEYDIPEEEITRIIPDEEIEQCTDEQEKEILRINNYFIFNGIKNIIGSKFFNFQENIILDSHSDHADLYSDIHQIFQLTENGFIAITDLPGKKKQPNDHNHKILKGLLGIIECRSNLGHGLIELNEGKKEEELNTDELSPVTEIIIGKNLLQIKSNHDFSTLEPLCNELEKLNRDYMAYISGYLVYIRINRPARLDDVKTMVGILRNLQDRVNGTHIPSGIPYG